MEKRILLLFVMISVLLLLSAEQSYGSFFSSLQFTRNALMGFSRGSERTVDIVLAPEKTTKMVNKTYLLLPKNKGPRMNTEYKLVERKGSGNKHENKTMVWTKYSNISTTKYIKDFLSPSLQKQLPEKLLVRTQIDFKNDVTENLILIPFNETVVQNKTKREVYEPRPSPSNKFMKAMNDIQRAQVNANASGVRYSDAALTKLKSLVERALRSKSYKYARQIVGQIMYFISTKPVSTGRRKRSSEKEGSKFLQGLRQRVGSTTFDSFLAVQGDASLMFVIDDTGSMREEIQAAKNIANDIINYQRAVPIKEYILSPFNDPYPYPTRADPVIVKSETKAGEFEEEINKLRASGGMDCPEYTFEGIRGALAKLSISGSPMYVFTDAGPKDATELDIEEVKMMAQDYGVTINFLATGYCSSRGYSRRDPRNLHPAFLDLAKSTSGLAMLFKDNGELEQISNWTIGTLEGDSIIGTGSTKSTGRGKRSAGGAADGRYSILVDDSIEKLSVTINTAREDTRGQGITLQDSDNVIVTSGKLSLSQITIYEINNPKRGTWTLTVSGSNGGHEFFAKSSSTTNVDFEHYFLIALSWRRGHIVEVPISNPVIGKLNKIMITVAGFEKLNNSSLRLQLITTDGNHIMNVALQSQSQGYFIASFTPHKTLVRSFKLKLKGTTRAGYPFERISRQTVIPATVVLRGKYASNDFTLPLGKITFIHFQLCNFGASETFDVVAVKDKLRYVLPRRLSPKRVQKGRCVIVSVYAKATRSQDVGKTNSVFVIMKGRISRVHVSHTVHLLVDH